MDHRVTQCPRCGTSFRVTEAHLAVAAGAVRCGSCLHIFNARDHWAEPPPAAAPARDPQPEPDFDIDDDLLIDDNTPLFGDEDDEQKSGARPLFNPVDEDFSALEMAAVRHDRLGDNDNDEYSHLDLDHWEQQSSSLFRELKDDETDGEEADEQWAQRLLADAEHEEAPLAAPSRSPIFEDLDSTLSPPEPGIPEQRQEIEDLAEEFRHAPAAPAGERSPEPAAEQPAPASAESIEPEPLRADERIGVDKPSPLFGDFETEPLQLHQFRREPRWPGFLWGAALATALALLAAQYLYFNFDTLARGPLRPWLASACAALDCSLPAQSDIARIHTGSLIVRSHPTNRGALAVDAIITNQAAFPQPFPELQLQFTDLNGTPVAGRRFHPGEYLGGELAGSRLMPVQQPVHIALELVDPGPRAVNYLLTVVPTGAH